MDQTPEPILPPPPAHAQPPVQPQPPNYAQPPVQAQPPASSQPPAYSQPAYSQPAYSQPAYSQPAYSQPAYSQPAYSQPAYSQPPMSQGPAPDSRNVLGILSLVAPFVGFSAVGIVLGHLGLSAVKKGLANNRGIALAGTIVSWVFTGLTIIMILAAIAIPVFLAQRTGAHEAAVKSDLVTIRASVETYAVYYDQVPLVEFSGGNYYVGDDVIGADSEVTDAWLYSSDGSSYCIEVQYGVGQFRSLDDNGDFGYGCS